MKPLAMNEIRTLPITGSSIGVSLHKAADTIAQEMDIAQQSVYQCAYFRYLILCAQHSLSNVAWNSLASYRFVYTQWPKATKKDL
jgi:hypothetical protein